MDEIKDIAEEGIANGIINNYTRDSNNIYIQFESGISYLFIPLEKGVLSGGEGGKILTVEPAKDSFGVMKESFVTFIDKIF